jgi:hypothetical protein
MKNRGITYAVLIVFMLAILFTGLLACLNKPTVAPPSDGQVIVRQSGGAAMLTAVCADKSYITQTADYIIEGTVEKVESRWNQEGTGIFTHTELAVEKYVKGASFTQTNIQIVTPGGTVGETSQWVEDQPLFHVGKKVRIYFKEVNEEFLIVCGQFGVEEQ